MNHRSKSALVAAIAAMAVMTAAGVRAQTAASPSETAFLVKTTGDLIRLCEAEPTDPTGIAALHFCHGFAVDKKTEEQAYLRGAQEGQR